MKFYRNTRRMLVALAAVAVPVLGLASYALYTPLPSRCKDPSSLRMMATISKIVHLSGRFLETTGLGSYASTWRKILPSSRKGDPQLEIKDIKFDGVLVRMYKRKDVEDQSSAGLVYIHGGGFIFGGIDEYDEVTRLLIKGSENVAVLVSVEYRLAPEHVFPAGFDDCYVATKHFLQNAEIFGVDPKRVAIIGDSAGGALALAVMNKIIDDKIQQKPKIQILIVPTLQAVNFRTPSYLRYNGKSERGFLTTEIMACFWMNYAVGGSQNLVDLSHNAHISSEVKQSKIFSYTDSSNLSSEISAGVKNNKGPIAYNGDLVDRVEAIFTNPYFSPLIANDETVSKYPKTLIMTGDFDPLMDDGLLLKQRLLGLNKEVAYTHFEGLDHTIIFSSSGRPLAFKELLSFINENL